MTAPTREQSVLGWAIHCDLIDSRDVDQDFVKSILEKLKEFSDLAYAQGRKDEREACAKVCDELVSPSRRHRDPCKAWITGTLDCAAAIRARGENENLS